MVLIGEAAAAAQAADDTNGVRALIIALSTALGAAIVPIVRSLGKRDKRLDKAMAGQVASVEAAWKQCLVDKLECEDRCDEERAERLKSQREMQEVIDRLRERERSMNERLQELQVENARLRKR